MFTDPYVESGVLAAGMPRAVTRRRTQGSDEEESAPGNFCFVIRKEAP
jgi:hypothetical protein